MGLRQACKRIGTRCRQERMFIKFEGELPDPGYMDNAKSSAEAWKTTYVEAAEIAVEGVYLLKRRSATRQRRSLKRKGGYC